jgi:5'-3' exonuclease
MVTPTKILRNWYLKIYLCTNQPEWVMVYISVPEVLAKFQIERPEQVIDFLGMMGDAADNIPIAWWEKSPLRNS